MARVLLANLAQETCSFVQSRHILDDFRRYYLYTGPGDHRKLRGGGMEIAGIIEAAEEEGIELVPLLATYGGTGGPVQSAAYTHLRDEILAGARRHAATADGVILALHGAMLTEDLDDPEGDLLAGLREILGPAKPIVCSLDLHAQRDRPDGPTRHGPRGLPDPPARGLPRYRRPGDAAAGARAQG